MQTHCLDCGDFLVRANDVWPNAIESGVIPCNLTALKGLNSSTMRLCCFPRHELPQHTRRFGKAFIHDTSAPIKERPTDLPVKPEERMLRVRVKLCIPEVQEAARQIRLDGFLHSAHVPIVSLRAAPRLVESSRRRGGN